MACQRSTSPEIHVQELTPPPIKKASDNDHIGEGITGTPRSGIGSSPSKHGRTQGRHNLRLAWAKSSNFRNTLNVPHGGSTHSVLSGAYICQKFY